LTALRFRLRLSEDAFTTEKQNAKQASRAFNFKETPENNNNGKTMQSTTEAKPSKRPSIMIN